MIEFRNLALMGRKVWQFAIRIPYLFHFCVDGDGWFNFAICPHYSILGPQSCNAPAALFYVERVPPDKYMNTFWLIQVERFLNQ